MFDKKTNEKIDFKNRFFERFGVEINHHDIRELTENIENGDNVTFVEKQSQRVSLYRTRIKDIICIVVYDHIRRYPVTCWGAKGEK